MIAGIGIDLFDARRFKKLRSDPEFLKQIFSPAEIEEIEAGSRKSPSAPLRFAVKESARKALGRELSAGWFWHRVRVGPGPAVRIAKGMDRFGLEKKPRIFHCAACHCRHFDLALTLIEE